MRIADITQELEKWAPRSWQENYDNVGMITGDPNQECTGVLCALDATEEVIEEVVQERPRGLQAVFRRTSPRRCRGKRRTTPRRAYRGPRMHRKQTAPAPARAAVPDNWELRSPADYA